MTSLLQQKTEMKLNKLKKRCVAEFLAAHPATHKTQEEIGAKFDKKIRKKKYKVLKVSCLQRCGYGIRCLLDPGSRIGFFRIPDLKPIFLIA
jgi:hypothetical protein